MTYTARQLSMDKMSPKQSYQMKNTTTFQSRQMRNERTLSDIGHVLSTPSSGMRFMFLHHKC